MVSFVVTIFHEYLMVYFVVIFLLLTGIAAGVFWRKVSPRRFVVMTLTSTVFLGVGAIPVGHAPPIIMPLWILVISLPTIMGRGWLDDGMTQVLGYSIGISTLLVAIGTGLLLGVVVAIRKIVR